MIRLFAIDLDGTMYTSQKDITTQVKNAIKLAKESGVQPVIVTGRGPYGVEIALEKLEMDLPYICAAGSLIHSGRNGRTIYTKSFHETRLLRHVIDFANKQGTAFLAEPLEGPLLWYGPDSVDKLLDPQTIKELNRNIRSQQPETDFDQPLLKLTLIANPKQLSEMEEYIRDGYPSVNMVYSGIQYIDITAGGANKGTALQFFAEHHGYQADEVAAIGDQLIDMNMLQYAGLPIAMKNGVKEVIQTAKWVAPSNDENGVAWAIEEILKHNRTFIQ